jgi:hypothetical protein
VSALAKPRGDELSRARLKMIRAGLAATAPEIFQGLKLLAPW